MKHYVQFRLDTNKLDNVGDKSCELTAVKDGFDSSLFDVCLQIVITPIKTLNEDQAIRQKSKSWKSVRATNRQAILCDALTGLLRRKSRFVFLAMQNASNLSICVSSNGSFIHVERTLI